MMYGPGEIKDIKFTQDNMVEILWVMTMDEYKSMYDGILTEIYNKEEEEYICPDCNKVIKDDLAMSHDYKRCHMIKEEVEDGA